MAKKLDQAKSNRSVIEGRLQRVEQFIEVFDSTTSSINLLKARLTMLDDIRKQYDEVQYALEQLDEQTTHEKRSIERGQFEDRYCAALAKINDIIDMKNAPAPPINTAPSVVGNQQNNASNNGFSQLNLPVLNLKTYDGSYKEWLNFENSFKSVIGENKNLNNCQRLQYLKSVLRNEALRAIESLPITDENYIIAWEALEKRFKNTRLIVEDHVSAILNAAPILKTSSTMLHELLDTVNTNMAALESLNIPVASWDAVIVLIIFQKLDYSTKREWQMTLDNSIPTYKKLIQFLEKRCTVLEALNATSSDKQNNAKTNHQQTGKPRTLTHAGVNKKLLCTFCKNSEHHIGQCGNFLELNAPDRNTQAKRLNLCTNCLRDNHKVANCFSNSKCRTCKGKHHTLLHLTQPAQQNDESITTNNHTLPVKNVSESVLLSTAVILIKNRKNQYVPCRAF
jgi:hypothetical protein